MLHAVHGLVGCGQNLFAVRAVNGVAGNAHAGPHIGHLPVVQGDGAAQGLDNLGRNLTQYRIRRPHAIKTRHKLVTANAAHQIGRAAQGSSQSVGAFDQNQITCLVAQTVVDLFESVQVNVQNADGHMVDCGLCHEMVQATSHAARLRRPVRLSCSAWCKA